MTHSFGAQSTTDDVLVGINLRGKRILVTGASAGLGVETCRALAARGADVVGAARDLDPQSALLRRLRIGAANLDVPHLSILAGGDNVVRPPLMHALPGGDVVVLPELGHNTLLFDEEAARLVKERVALHRARAAGPAADPR